MKLWIKIALSIAAMTVGPYLAASFIAWDIWWPVLPASLPLRFVFVVVWLIGAVSTIDYINRQHGKNKP